MITGTKSLIDYKIEDDNLQYIYDSIRLFEPIITKDIIDLDVKLKGLEYSVKTASSIKDKLERQSKLYEKREIQFSDVKELSNMKDIIRYTEIVKNKNIIKNTNKTIAELEKKGYVLCEIKNYYKHPIPETGYMGMHLNFISPYGQEIEIQIATEEGYKIKNNSHELYEQARAIATPIKEKLNLVNQIYKIHQSIEKPPGYKTINNFYIINKEKIKEEKRKCINIEINQEQHNKTKAMTYSIYKNGENIFHGFEIRQSDDSIFLYQNNWKDMSEVYALTNKGELITSYKTEKQSLSIKEVLNLATEFERENDEWMILHSNEISLDDLIKEKKKEETEKIDAGFVKQDEILL